MRNRLPPLVSRLQAALLENANNPSQSHAQPTPAVGVPPSGGITRKRQQSLPKPCATVSRRWCPAFRRHFSTTPTSPPKSNAQPTPAVGVPPSGGITRQRQQSLPKRCATDSRRWCPAFRRHYSTTPRTIQRDARRPFNTFSLPKNQFSRTSPREIT